MFPVSDFNFVVAGIATVAATVGYACTRRLSQSISPQSVEDLRQAFDTETRPIEKDALVASEEHSMEITSKQLHDQQMDGQDTTSKTASTPTRKDSLKRKIPHDGFDEPEKEVILDYPHNLANIYPNKRSKTPSSDSETATPIVSSSIALESTASFTSDKDIESVPTVPVEPIPAATPATEPPRTPSPVPEETSPRQPSPTPVPVSPPPMRVATPQPATPARNVARLPVTPKPFSSPSGGFAAFAGSKSPFATIGKPKLGDGSSFKSSKSIWSVGDFATHQNEGELTGALAPAFKCESPDAHAISEAKATGVQSTEKQTQITGEEDEDVELELKGVKLYIMRGDKPFGDGVLGQVKLLSHKKTLEERILFRREPLWKVSMNVRVGPAVACKYSVEQDGLRLIVTEPVENTSGSDAGSDPKYEVVVYALRPGRSCAKSDFRDFAETLMKSPHFKPTPP